MFFSHFPLFFKVLWFTPTHLNDTSNSKNHIGMLCHPQSQELEAVAKQPDYPWAVSKIPGCTSMPLKYGDLPIYSKKHVALEVGKFLPEMATYLWALLKFHMFHVFFFWLCITMLFWSPTAWPQATAKRKRRAAEGEQVDRSAWSGCGRMRCGSWKKKTMFSRLVWTCLGSE